MSDGGIFIILGHGDKDLTGEAGNVGGKLIDQRSLNDTYRLKRGMSSTRLLLIVAIS